MTLTAMAPSIVPENLRLAAADAAKIAAGLTVILVLPMVSFWGGMPALLTVFASALALHVYRVPGSVIFVGPLFLLAADVFLPSAARFDSNNLAEPWEMYYWAAGILLITLAPLPKLGWKAWTQCPRSLQAFALVAVGASVYGYAHGISPNYVLRQLFGSLLLVAYFIFAQQYGDEETFLRKTLTYGVPCALAFMIYYAWVFPERGIHKEITSVGTQCAILGILFAARGSGRRWAAAATMFVVPCLIVMRHDLAAIVLAMVLVWGFTARSRLQKWMAWGMTPLIVGFSLSPPLVAFVLDAATGTSAMDKLLPAGSRDNGSIEDRSLQLLGAASVLEGSPIFGGGLGSELEWDSVARGVWAQHYVDNGWAYLAAKMGFAGILTFGWFLLALLRKMPGGSIPLSACLLSMLLLAMFAEPVFFQFSTSPFLGAIAGLLFIQRHIPRTGRAGLGSGLAVREYALPI
jgi:hypothetical protein